VTSRACRARTRTSRSPCTSDYSQAYGNASGGSLASPENDITGLWDGYQAGFAVVTSQEVDSGIVKLSQYKAVLPTNGVDANLTAYKAAVGNLLTTGSQLAQYAPAYASRANSGVVQIVPDVASGGTSAQLTLANITSGTAYDDSTTFSPSGLGLASGSHHVVNASGPRCRPFQLRRQRAGGLRHAHREPRADRRAVARLVQRRLHAGHAG
jgi:hypothetical protein